MKHSISHLKEKTRLPQEQQQVQEHSTELWDPDLQGIDSQTKPAVLLGGGKLPVALW
jgi:hypothetical protein